MNHILFSFLCIPVFLFSWMPQIYTSAIIILPYNALLHLLSQIIFLQLS
jgi:hypothetical protein